MAIFPSSTQDIPEAQGVPRHVAIIMDGNGRWAKSRFLPRIVGHQRGVEVVRGVVEQCVELGIGHLTLFAFSSENWRRPKAEVKFLLELFMQALGREVQKLHRHQIRFSLIGDRSRFEPQLVQAIHEAETLTRHNTRMVLTVAANYGGRWDVVQAANRMLHTHPEYASGFTEQDLAPYMCLHDAPEPDLFIRTGGEQRISNFLLWQLAYTECYFTPILWPDFDREAFRQALDSYRQRERRFGRTSEQLGNP